MMQLNKIVDSVSSIQREADNLWQNELHASGITSEDRYSISVAAAAGITRKDSEITEDQLVALVAERVADKGSRFRSSVHHPEFREFLFEIVRDIRSSSEEEHIAVIQDLLANLLVRPPAAALGEDPNHLLQRANAPINRCIATMGFKMDVLGQLLTT